MVANKLDFNFLARAYFYWDKPVEYIIDGSVLNIYPVSVVDSELFLASATVLTFDKDSIPDPDVISMSYLEFMLKYLFEHDSTAAYKLRNIFRLCLHMDEVYIGVDEDTGKHFLCDKDQTVVIKAKKFNEIRSIILHQNMPDYDDGYINPELKADMDETDFIRGMNIETLTIEDRMAIITTHTGVGKQEQMSWTMRYHQKVFSRVCAESRFDGEFPIALYAGKADKIDHWIFKKKVGKFDGYITSRGEFAKSMGADESQITSSSNGHIDQMDALYQQNSK